MIAELDKQIAAIPDATMELVGGPAEEGEYPRLLEKRGESPPQHPDLEAEPEE